MEVSPLEPLPSPAGLQLVIDLAADSSAVPITDVADDQHVLEDRDWSDAPHPLQAGSALRPLTKQLTHAG